MTKGRLPGQGAMIRHGSVDDPNPTLRGQRQKAAINVHTDSLEREYANGRLTEAGYHAGRAYRAVLERSRRPISAAGAWNPGNRVDQVISHEIAILSRIEKAADAVDMVRDTAPVLGFLGQRLLELVLVDEVNLTEAARQLRGRADRQDVIFYSELFRQSCEALAKHWAGEARAPRTPHDHHRAAAAGMTERESVSVRSGTTLERLSEELSALEAAPRLSDEDRAEMRRLARRVSAMLADDASDEAPLPGSGSGSDAG